MTYDRPLPAGKLPPNLMVRLLSRGDPLPDEVLVAPSVGEDACVIDLPAGALVATTDPITLTGSDVGRYVVTVNANDVAVMGVKPRWFLAAVLMPIGTTEAQIESLFADIRTHLVANGIALVGGHTEVSDAVTRPVVVGQMMGIADDDHFVRTNGVRPGQIVLQVGAAPIEGAAVLASQAGPLLEAVDADLLAAAKQGLDAPGISVVKPALLAARLGAVAMHDPTEGGLASGLHELAFASGVRLRVDRQQVRWWQPSLAICDAVAADPWATLASGTLLAAFDHSRAGSAGEELAAAGYVVARIAVAEDGEGVIDTNGETIGWPERDEINRILEQLSAGP